MSRRSKSLFISVLFLAALSAGAADLAANASGDAMRLVACMKAYDAACVNSLTYTKVLEDHGISRDQLEQAVTNMYQQMKARGARYSRFDLDAPWEPFVSVGLTYVFIPYHVVLKAHSGDVLAKSFFIGVSDDSGVSWKFVDGQKVTKDNIKMIIPGYDGRPLPPTSMN